MKERTKEIVKDGFGCLVKNSAAIRGAKNGPLWLTLVMFFLSILLPILPFFIAGNSASGSAFIKSKTYNLEKYIPVTANELLEDNYEFAIGEDHKLSVLQNGSEIVYATYDVTDVDTGERTITPLKSYIDSETNEYRFVLYVSDLSTSAEKKLYLNTIANKIYEAGTTTESHETAKERKNSGKDYYYPSIMIIFKDSFNIAISYGEKSITGSTSGAADYKTMKATNNCLAELLTVLDKEGNIIDNGKTFEQKMANPDYYNGVLKNFKKFLDKSYESSKVKTILYTCLFNLALFVGLSVIMGFLIWILTRGKNNPNNYFSIWLCYKIQMRLGLAPGLITFILGLFLTSYAQMIFVLTLGLRVMWMSMKDLRPIQQ